MSCHKQVVRRSANISFLRAPPLSHGHERESYGFITYCVGCEMCEYSHVSFTPLYGAKVSPVNSCASRKGFLRPAVLQAKAPNIRSELFSTVFRLSCWRSKFARPRPLEERDRCCFEARRIDRGDKEGYASGTRSAAAMTSHGESEMAVRSARTPELLAVVNLRLTSPSTPFCEICPRRRSFQSCAK